MSVPTDDNRSQGGRAKRGVHSPVWIALRALYMAWIVWFAGRQLRDGGFDWVPVIVIAGAGLAVGLDVAQLQFPHRRLLRRRPARD